MSEAGGPRVFTLTDAGMASLRARMLLRLGLTVAAVAGIGMAIKVLLPILDWFNLIFVSAVVLLIVLMNGYRAIQKQENVLRSLQIELGPDYVLRRQDGVPEIRIGRDEIAALADDGPRLLVVSRDGARRLAVPAEIGDQAQAEVRAALAAFLKHSTGR